MAYNYFPSTYQTYYPQTGAVNYPYVQPPAQAPQQSANNGLIWVQGETGAKSYIVAPNATVMLMDSEQERFYLKSCDASGMPLPLRVFEYRELTEKPKIEAQSETGAFVTKQEFDYRLSQIESLLQEVKSNG